MSTAIGYKMARGGCIKYHSAGNRLVGDLSAKRKTWHYIYIDPV